MNRNSFLPIASLINQILRFASIFLLMSLTSPETYSGWVTITLIMQYSLFLQLGGPQAMHREIAIAKGNNDYNYIAKLTISSLYNYIFATILLLTLLVVFHYEYLLIPTFIYIFLVHLGNLFLLQARASFKIKRASLAILFDGIILITSAMLLVPKYGIMGLLVSLSLGALMNILICYPKELLFTGRPIFKKFVIEDSRKLIKHGIPLLVFNFLFLLRDSWDFIFIKIFYANEYVEYVSSHVFGRGVSVIGSLIGLVFIPIMARNFGKTQQMYNIKNFEIIKKIVTYLALAFIIFTLLWFNFSSFLIINFLPDFYESLDVITYRTISVFFSLLILPYYFVFNSSRNPSITIRSTILSIFFSFILFIVLSNYLTIAVSMISAMFISNIALFIFLSLYYRHHQEQMAIK